MTKAAYEFQTRISYGIEFGDITPTAEAAIAAKTLFPTEVPSLKHFAEVTPRALRSAKALRSALERSYRMGSDEDVQRADSTARVIGSAVASYAGDIIPLETPFTFDRNTICFVGLRIACPEPVTVVDHGMGFQGTFSHKDHLRNTGHSVYASAADDIEAGGIEGLVKGLHYPEDSVSVLSGAIDLSEVLLDNGTEGQVDLILASQIHLMDRDTLRGTLELAPRLLGKEGLIIIRGPKANPNGLTTAEQAGVVSENPTMTLLSSYNTTSPDTSPYPNLPQQAFVFGKN